MRKTATFLLVATAALFPFRSKDTSEAAQLSRTILVQDEPGKLETFLLSIPNTSVKEQPLGALPAPEDRIAKFTTIVAEHPLSKKKAKGLKVQLKDGEHADVVYLDEEGLKEWQHRLISLVAGERFFEEHLDSFSASEVEKPAVSFAINQSPATGEFYAALGVGSYRSDGRFGVYLHAPWGTHHHSLQLWLPNASTSHVVDLVTVGNAFLQAN